MKLIMITLLVVTYLLGAEGSQGSWGYGKTHNGVYGPADWGHVSKDCDGHAQSPVNIVTNDVDSDDDDDVNDKRELDVNFDNAFGLVTGTLVNNGHSPTFTVDKTQGGASLISPLDGQIYKLEQFHFHFGCVDKVGSEHTVDGRSYPGELHLVFYNNKYDNFGKAASQPDGLTVIGAFLKNSFIFNLELLWFSRNFDKIVEEGTKTVGVSAELGNMVKGLPSGDLAYYTYKGSLTTPGCYESVRWVVLKDPIDTSNIVLNRFRALKATHGYMHGKMCNNYRPTQPLNGRTVRLF